MIFGRKQNMKDPIETAKKLKEFCNKHKKDSALNDEGVKAYNCEECIFNKDDYCAISYPGTDWEV